MLQWKTDPTSGYKFFSHQMKNMPLLRIILLVLPVAAKYQVQLHMVISVINKRNNLKLLMLSVS